MKHLVAMQWSPKPQSVVRFLAPMPDLKRLCRGTEGPSGAFRAPSGADKIPIVHL